MIRVGSDPTTSPPGTTPTGGNAMVTATGPFTDILDAYATARDRPKSAVARAGGQ
jgi:hypothetical protein